MRLAATQVQSHANFACTSDQYSAKPPVFLASTLREQLFELKNEDAIKNLRIYATYVLAKAYPYGPILSHETVPLNSKLSSGMLSSSAGLWCLQ